MRIRRVSRCSIVVVLTLLVLPLSRTSGHTLSSPAAPGDFTARLASLVPLTCVASDPATGYIYAQADAGTAFYRYDPWANSWTSLADSPLNSGNNGGAQVLDGKLYTVYTGNSVHMGVYDIAGGTWSVIGNGLGEGTGNIATDGQFLYLVAHLNFKRYDPVANSWLALAAPPFSFEAWGGLDALGGMLYGHRGNGGTDFARYDIASNSWTTLSSLPGGAVLGSAIDPAGKVYYAYGNYGENTWYAFDLDTETWTASAIPLFNVNDGGLAHVGQAGVSGIYFVQGDGGTGFGRFEPYPAAPGDFTARLASLVPLTCVASDPATGYIYAQANAGTAFYRYDPWADSWTSLADSPLNSENNGGAQVLDGKLYTVYTGNSVHMGVYDIAGGTWSVIGNGLGEGTGNIATDGQFLYLVAHLNFKRYDPVANSWLALAAPPFSFEAWGGLDALDGMLYGHQGNEFTDFARYDIASNSWTTLSSLPGCAVLGSAIDPAGKVYYAYGNYGENTWYAFDLDTETWIASAIPFFNVNDGGLAHVSQAGVSGIYFVQGDGGTGFGRFEPHQYIYLPMVMRH